VLVDEVLTPDSSRFWPADEYEVGKTQDSFDKVSYLRDCRSEVIVRKEKLTLITAISARLAHQQRTQGQGWSGDA